MCISAFSSSAAKTNDSWSGSKQQKHQVAQNPKFQTFSKDATRTFAASSPTVVLMKVAKYRGSVRNEESSSFRRVTSHGPEYFATFTFIRTMIEDVIRQWFLAMNFYLLDCLEVRINFIHCLTVHPLIEAIIDSDISSPPFELYCRLQVEILMK